MPSDIIPKQDYEQRLRSALAQSALKNADAGAVDGALVTLAQIYMGQNPDGTPMKVEARTRAGAAAALLRAHIDISTLSKRVQDEGDGRITLNIVIGQPTVRSAPLPPAGKELPKGQP